MKVQLPFSKNNMKISQQTLSILKNFNGLNPNFGVKPGNTIRTISAAVIASAEIQEEFTSEFAVANLSKFISAITLFQEPEFEFYDLYVKISEGKNYVRYVYDEPSLMSLPPDKNIKMPSRDVEFDLTEADFSLLGRAMSSLQSPQLVISGEDGTIYVKATDIKNPTTSNFSMAVGVADTEFETPFNALNFKFLPAKYTVSLCIDKIVEFKSDLVTYWIAAKRD
jgi:hypothetical protein